MKIYWCNWSKTHYEWPQIALMSYKPTFLSLDSVFDNKEITNKKETISACPAHRNLKSNTIILRSPKNFSFSFENEGLIIPDENHHHLQEREKQLSKRNSVNINIGWIFFSEVSLKMICTPPHNHKTQVQNYGVIASGEYDCGRWFRPVNMEYLLWPDENNFHINENEPVCYIKFDTEERIELVEFVCTDKIVSFVHACSNHPVYYRRGMKLSDRYKKFDESNLKKVILKEIKNNLV